MAGCRVSGHYLELIKYLQSRKSGKAAGLHYLLRDGELNGDRPLCRECHSRKGSRLMLRKSGGLPAILSNLARGYHGDSRNMWESLVYINNCCDI